MSARISVIVMGFLLHIANIIATQESIKGSIAQSPECRDAVAQICGDQNLASDVTILDCLQNRRSESDGDLTDECHSYLWRFKLNITKGDQFLRSTQSMCHNEISNFTECSDQTVQGHKLSCLLENLDSIKPGQCKAFLVKIGSIIFSDFRLIEKFAESCTSDIEKLKCGRIDQTEEKDHKQGSTIECLSQHSRDLKPECHLQILRIAELQADDYTLDRPLYLACRDDRERFCANVQAGEGRVYKCLMKNKLQNGMSEKCQEQLTRRQQLISEDYKVSKGLMRACRKDIQNQRCAKSIQGDKDRKVKLAHVLLCLENALHQGEAIGGECRAEMLDHRRSLLEDFRLSPEIVAYCHKDIEEYCHSREIGGKTLHCLMKHSKKRLVEDRCRRALEDLLQVADTSSDWEVDNQLKEACHSVVDTLCSNRDNNPASILPCLINKMYSDQMTTSCRNALLEIQYFVARDFRLDSQLYSQCRDDAVNFCHAQKDWAQDPSSMSPNGSPLILPCLYGLAYHPPPDRSLKPECADEVRRAMKQRANSVDLMPEIEEECIQDLSQFCSAKIGHGEEMICLQDHFDDLQERCRLVVSNYTEDEAEHLELNPIISTVCGRFLENNCEEEQNNGDEGQVMDCLIESKMNPEVKMNSKCRAAIEHFQIISLKDYRFSAAFKRACKGDINQFCPNLRAKPKVVYCLSEIVRNDTLNTNIAAKIPVQHRISQPCRQQLRSQLIHQHENVVLNPILDDSCKEDVKKFCAKVERGEGRVMECLRDHRKELRDKCHQAIFKSENEEMSDNALDFQLNSQCKETIHSFCPNDRSQVLNCLKRNINEKGFDPRCKTIVLKRMIEQNMDIRFNPELRASCFLDIQKFCYQVMEDKPVELEGKVLHCLKENYVYKKKLSPSCADHVKSIMQQQVLHYKQDSVLQKDCGEEIKKHCALEDLEGDNKGSVEECLKSKFENLESKPCRRQVALLISAAQIDIEADPLLHDACTVDIVTNCKGVPPGEGRRLNCLLRIMNQSKDKLDPKCLDMLTARTRLFGSANKVAPPETANELFDQISVSPARNYLLGIGLTLIGCIFVFGIFCGRVSKRHKILKNK